MKRIVCIGGWGHWPEVFQALEKRSDIELCGVAPAYEGEDLGTICSRDLMSGVPRFGNVDELLQTPADFCIISTRPGRIAAANIKAAKAGLDIISEKPIGITLDELDAVEVAVKENGVRLMVMLTMRSFPVFQAAEQLFKGGAIGALALVNARKSYKYGNRPEWFGDRSAYGGTFPWVGIHALDMISFVTGQKPTAVAALQANQAHPDRPDCEDACCGVFNLNGGALASVSVDLLRPKASGTHGDDWIRIVGTAGVIEARVSENSCRLLRDDKEPVDVELLPARSLYDPFLDGEFGLTGPSDAVDLTRAVLCARQAADEKRWIEI